MFRSIFGSILHVDSAPFSYVRGDTRGSGKRKPIDPGNMGATVIRREDGNPHANYGIQMRSIFWKYGEWMKYGNSGNPWESSGCGIFCHWHVPSVKHIQEGLDVEDI